MFVIIELLGINPTSLSTGSPFLNTNKVGSPLTWYCFAVSMLSSVLIFANLTLEESSVSTSSKIGANFLQGPHQFAKKSTTTISLFDKTSSLKLLLHNSTYNLFMLLYCRGDLQVFCNKGFKVRIENAKKKRNRDSFRHRDNWS